MNVDFLHDQIIRDTVTPAFISSFNENLLPLLMEKYGESLEYVQFYENHIADGFRVGGVFYYPLTVVVTGVAKTEWISWQVSNYRIYDNFNPFSYKGQDSLAFSFAERVPESALQSIIGKPIYSPGNALPVIMNAETDDKTFLAGKYAQSFIDLMSSELCELVERELMISGLSGSGVVLEMNFAPGTYMEHIVENTTYRRLRIKARACASRDFWVKWTRLDGNGTYTISDIVDRSMIRFELGEDVSGKIKEKEYRYLTTESIEKYQESMSRKNITAWRDVMRRVIRRGEVEKLELLEIEMEKPKEEPVFEEAVPMAEPEEVLISEPTAAEHAVTEPAHIQTLNAEMDRSGDDITDRLNALLGKSDVEFSRESDTLADSINADLGELLKNALGIAQSSEEKAEEPKEELDEAVAKEETDSLEEEQEAEEAPTEEPEMIDLARALEILERGEEEEDIEEEPVEDELEAAIDAIKAEPVAEEAPIITEESPVSAPVIDESAIEARIRRELEEKMRAEMDELRKKTEEAEALRAKLEAQKKAEAREKELLAEAARQAILDTERREAERRAEAERERVEAERKAEAERIAKEEEARRIEAERAERERIEAELKAKLEREKAEKAAEAAKKARLTKSVNLVFRRGVVDKAMTKRVHEIIVATIKYLGKENVYMRIKATVPDPTTLNLTFSEIPAAEQQLVVDIIQVLGKSNLGIIKAVLE